MDIQPLRDFVLLSFIGPLEVTSKGGNFLPGTSSFFAKYEVVAVGSKVEERLGLQLKAGMIVVAHAESGWRIADKRLLGANDIYAIIKE